MNVTFSCIKPTRIYEIQSAVLPAWQMQGHVRVLRQSICDSQAPTVRSYKWNPGSTFLTETAADGKVCTPHQFHRQTALRIFRAFSCIMSLYSFFQIVRPASVETTVPTLHNICIIHDFSFNWGRSKTSFYYVPNYTHSLSFCHIIYRVYWCSIFS